MSHLQEIINYLPLVMAIMVGFNALMFGLYSAFSQLVTKSAQYAGNVYIQAMSKFSTAALKILNVIGYNPSHAVPISAVQQEKSLAPQLTFDQQISNAQLIYDAKKAGGEQDVVSSVADLFTVALSLWLNAEKTKYIDKKMSLLNQWNAEYNKPDRSRLALDQIKEQLDVLQIAFITAATSGSSS